MRCSIPNQRRAATPLNWRSNGISAKPDSRGQDQTYDMDEGAVGKAKQSQVGHGFRSNLVCPQFIAETGAGREDAGPPGTSRALAPPEGLVGFAQRLFLREADVLQQVGVVALGNFA